MLGLSGAHLCVCLRLRLEIQLPRFARLFAENLTRAIVEAKGLSEDTYQKILQVLLKPHKHKHREGKKAKVVKVFCT